jgi:hypothetical protein
LRRRFFRRMKLMPLIRLRDHLRVPPTAVDGEAQSRLS